ncbi:MAG: SH3 domain-containing protein [Dokdonella sp.]
MRLQWLTTTSLALLVGCAPQAMRVMQPVPDHDVLGVDGMKLTPDFWVARLAHPDAVILDAAAIAAQNARLLKLDPSMYNLQRLPTTTERAQVARWIGDLSERPSEPLFDIDGHQLTDAMLDALLANLALDAIAEHVPTRYGLIVQRAALRAFPSRMRVFNSVGDTDIDRFQESELYPGMPVAIVHASRDGEWWFVVSPRYAAWIEKRYVAEGSAQEVFDYVDKAPYRVVTGAVERTVFTREQPAVSQLQLDMGVRLPLLSSWRADQPVNGQHAYTSHLLELPLRADDGSLRFAPALLQKNADSADAYLPLTSANVIRQAFKFLGERYGWGHSYDARDCSGFVSDVYRSMGIEMPRNTSAQSISPAFNRRPFTQTDGHDVRYAAARALGVGDLVYIPGHVMMVLGRLDGEPYVIHDTSGLSYRAPDGSIMRVKLNEVSVTPLLPLLLGNQQSYVDQMTSIVRMRP